MPNHSGEPQRPLPNRLMWFVALWLGGVCAVGLLALLIRSVLL